MSKAEKVHIIGIGDDGLQGLTDSARRLLQQAEMVIGTEQTLLAIDRHDCETVPVSGDYDVAVRRIAASPERKIVVLASGDPLFYGVARFLCEKLGKERFEVVPHVSSMQMAFARVKESWDEAYLANLATLDLERTVEKIRLAETAGLFTTEQITPSHVARALLERRIDYFSAYVCENLGSPDERVTTGELSDIAEQRFAPLNVMILVRKPDVPDRPRDMVGRRLFGNPDDVFIQSQPKRGLLTPMEVRTIALADLDLGPASTVWDVGAGSGSVSVEAAQIAASGSVYAIEVDPADYQLISENAQRFGLRNLVPVLGRAPAAWDELPDPDAIFVGGTGRAVAGIVELAFARLRPGGRIVVNVGSVDNLASVHSLMRKLAHEVQVRMINIAHATDQLESARLEARSPTFLITATKAN